jgi:hypothetical protein
VVDREALIWYDFYMDNNTTTKQAVALRGLFAAACSATGHDQGRLGGPAEYLGERWPATIRGILRGLR